MVYLPTDGHPFKYRINPTAHSWTGSRTRVREIYSTAWSKSVAL